MLTNLNGAGALPKVQGLDSMGSSGFRPIQSSTMTNNPSGQPYNNNNNPAAMSSSSSSSHRPKSPYYHGLTYESMFDTKIHDIGSHNLLSPPLPPLQLYTLLFNTKIHDIGSHKPVTNHP